MTGDSAYSARWVIYFVGYNQDVPLLVASAAGLNGGKDGSIPSITASTRR